MCACEHGLALRMGLQLARLCKQHGVKKLEWQDIVHVPLIAATEQPQLLTGIASTAAIDQHRMSIRPHCLTLPRKPSSLPLLLKHRADVVAGTIDELAYDDNGQLNIRCTVDHPEARRMNAFSVGVTVQGFEMINADRPDFYARILAGRVDEVSLTDVPANGQCRVTARYPVSAQVQFIDQTLSAMRLIQQTLTVLQQQMHQGART